MTTACEVIKWLRTHEALQNRFFFLGLRIAHTQLQEEAVDLCLGQRKRAFEFDRVLRRDDHERSRQHACFAVERDAALLHGFQQRRLRAWGGTVDFVRQDDLPEDRPRTKLERAGLLVDRRSQPVTSEGSRSGVNWMRRNSQLERAGQCACQCRFARPWHIFQ